MVPVQARYTVHVIEKTERRRSTEKVVQVPYDEHFDWNAAFAPDPEYLLNHPEMRTAYEVKSYLQEVGLTMNDLRGKKLLDIGAGTGYFVKEAVRHGVDAYAIDILPPDSSGHLPRSEPIVPAEIPTFVQGSAYQLPFADNTFDVIVSRYAPLSNFEWAEDDGALGKSEDPLGAKYPAIYEAMRVLKPGGEIRFELGTASTAPWEEFLRVLRTDQRIELTEEVTSTWDLGRAKGENYRLVIKKRTDSSGI